MRNLKYTSLIIILSIFWNCNEADNSTELSSIEIGDYRFNFPAEFTLEELQGIDSYVGYIHGSGISLSFDYGWYTSPLSNIDEDEYIVTEDELNGHFRQIVKAIVSEENFTRIHLFKISNSINSPYGYNSLSIVVNNLNISEQEMILNVFNSVEIIE